MGHVVKIEFTNNDLLPEFDIVTSCKFPEDHMRINTSNNSFTLLYVKKVEKMKILPLDLL